MYYKNTECKIKYRLNLVIRVYGYEIDLYLPKFLKVLRAITFSFSLLIWSVLSGQGQQFQIVSIGFYNLENLFDTVDDPKIDDSEFLPDGKRAWTEEKYKEKLANMAYVISQIGIEDAKAGLSVLGLSEIENRKVLEDLVKEPAIASRNYRIIHYDSPDPRGVDVALLYNPSHFKYLESRAIPMYENRELSSRKTRDILHVKGMLGDDTIHIMVNHWPSRGGGEELTAPLRNHGAKHNRRVYDELLKIDPNVKFITMGDLNDDPINESVTGFLRAKSSAKKLRSGDLFNPFYDFYNRGQGSNAYRDSWSLFDQIIISEGLVNKKNPGFYYLKANIFNKKFLVQPSGQYKGYPFRTFSGDTYQGGYSDHFPTYILLVKPLPKD